MIHKVFLLRKVARQQGVTALLLYQAQTVSFRMQRLQIPKKTVKPLFLILRLTHCAGRWQSTSWVMLLPYQKQDKKSWKPSHNRHYGACGLYGTYQSMQETSCLPGVQLPGVPILRKEILPNTFLEHPVEMQGVLLYD